MISVLLAHFKLLGNNALGVTHLAKPAQNNLTTVKLA